MLMQNAQYAADFEKLAVICREKNVAMQLIKTLQRRPWDEDAASAGRTHWAATWYEPFAEPWAIERATHFGLGRPGVFINTAGDIHVLPHILEAANRYERPPSQAEMQELISQQSGEPLWA
jgi:hypothetical protein